MKITTEEFIIRSNLKHDNKYDYSKTKYVRMHEDVEIICNIHGAFFAMPTAHIHSGTGCPKCAIERAAQKQTKTTDWFVSEAEKIHGNKYDYSKTKYIKNKTPLTIICKTHGEFLQAPNNHLSMRQGCPKCAGNIAYTTDEYIEKAKSIHGDRYDYSLVKYSSYDKNVTLICKTHGSFKCRAGKHINHNQGCPKCVGKYITTEEFIIRARVLHVDRYDYSSTIYKSTYSNVSINCPHHGQFDITPKNHLRGLGCPKCSPTISNPERQWLDFINLPNTLEHRQHLIKINKKKFKVDGFDPNTNTIFEFLGDFWHGNPKMFNPTDINTRNKKSFQQLHDETFHRFDLLKEAGYNVVYIWESDFKELIKLI